MLLKSSKATFFFFSQLPSSLPANNLFVFLVSTFYIMEKAVKLVKCMKPDVRCTNTFSYPSKAHTDRGFLLKENVQKQPQLSELLNELQFLKEYLTQMSVVFCFLLVFFLLNNQAHCDSNWFVNCKALRSDTLVGKTPIFFPVEMVFYCY